MISIYLSATISILAGLFLATLTAKGPDSMIQLLANGMGWYVVARGIYMAASVRNIANMAQGLNAPNKATHKQCDACYLWVPKGATKCGHCHSPLE
jgi:uncharacterized membrane protein YedE/YeeE